jgi:hypothetical protein
LEWRWSSSPLQPCWLECTNQRLALDCHMPYGASLNGNVLTSWSPRDCFQVESDILPSSSESPGPNVEVFWQGNCLCFKVGLGEIRW